MKNEKDEQEILKNDLKIMEKFECPFTWDMNDIVEYERAEKPYHANDDEDFFPLLKLIRNLMSLFYYTSNNKDDKLILEYLDKGEENFQNFMANSHPEISLIMVNYVWKATQTFVYQKLNMKDKMKEVISKIKEIEVTDNKDHSTLAALKSMCWSKYHKIGSYKAEKFIRNAIDLNSKCDLWYFILAKNLRRQRRDASISIVPSHKEIENFKKAFEMSPKCIVYELFMAQMYRENNEQHKAIEVYTKIYESKPESTTILLRLALGFIRFYKFGLAKKCLDAVANQTSELSMFNHYNGIYYMKQKNYELALPYYEKAIKDYNLAAEKDHLQCLIKLRSPIDITQELLNLVTKYKDLPDYQLQSVFLDLALCFWLKKNNIPEAINYFVRAIEINPDCGSIKKYCDYLNLLDGNKNIFKVIAGRFIPIIKRNNQKLDDNSLKKLKELEVLCEVHYSNECNSMEKVFQAFRL